MIIRGDCIQVMQDLDCKFDLVFADPPYNLGLKNKLKRPDGSDYQDLLDSTWDKFDSLEQYEQFTEKWLTQVKRVMKKKSSLWVSGSYHNLFIVGNYLLKLNFEILNHIVWIKDNPTPQFSGTRFCQSHESLLWAKLKGGTHYFNYKELKKNNGNRQVRADWYLPTLREDEKIMTSDGRVNQAQKPEHLLYQIIMSSSKENDLVLDPFCGTGTTGKVCTQLGREFVGIEKDPKQADIAEQRIWNTMRLLF